MSTCENRGQQMNLMNEDLARAHCRERLQQAHSARRATSVARSVRLARRAERATRAVKLQLAREL